MPCFLPDSNVTRGQLAKIEANTAALADPIPSSQQTFADVLPNNPFWLFIERLAGRGAISGYSCGSPAINPCTQQVESCDEQFLPIFVGAR